MEGIPTIELAPRAFIDSPPFKLSRPHVINAELISSPYRDILEKVWTKGQFPEQPVSIFRLRGAYAYGECILLDRQFRFIANVSGSCSREEVARAIADTKADEAAHLIPYVGETTIYVKGRAAHNYGHFLLDIFPLAALGKQLFDWKQPRYLIYNAPPTSTDVMLRALRLTSINLNDLIVQPSHRSLFFEDLIVTANLNLHGQYMSPLSVSLTGQMADRISPRLSNISAGIDSRLFVQRVTNLPRARHILNETAVFERLSAQGFKAIDPGIMSLEQQIEAFRDADDIVGPIGAAMANIVFCRPGARVTLFVPALFPDTFFMFIAEHKKLRYTEIRCPQLVWEGPECWRDGARVEEKDIQWLEAISASSGHF